MNKSKSLLVVGVLAITSLFSSCSTDNTIECPEEFTGPLLENENVLLGTWKLTAITSEKEVDITDDQQDNPNKNIYQQYSACERDASYTFETNRGYKYNQAENTDDCSNKLKINGSWKYTGKVLSLVGNCSSQNVVLEFNEENTAYTFSLNSTVRQPNGEVIQTVVTFTYTKDTPENELETEN
ncbi:DUF5004 domain-containing protein [Arenibacter sp. 6A1]|uniref:DUF5004 domain-containing protein n=1 Tax=Arenibacter sp. 6A1 TaxID=2720391 RepID=UPI001447A799|nr:DUF5004 domain-containing protein [Arenibacter sp. 6A1]NKI26504.1 DUF5004 domain-containing protein [Arenibacter sp. 6A1]